MTLYELNRRQALRIVKVIEDNIQYAKQRNETWFKIPIYEEDVNTLVCIELTRTPIRFTNYGNYLIIECE